MPDVPMKKKAPTEQELRKVFCEIAQGFTPVSFGGEPLIIKHLRQHDQYLLENRREEIYSRAKEQGLPTEEEAIATLIEGDVWSKEEDDEITSLEQYLKNLHDTKSNLIIPSQIENINKDITEAAEKLNALNGKKHSMLTQTCEGYAQLKSNDYSIYLCLYRDQKFKKKFLSWERFGELTKPELGELLEVYTNGSEHLNINNIKHLALSHIFSMYYNLTGGENLQNFFGAPLPELSFYQLNLLNYGKVLNSILENVEGIPQGIKEDPDDLMAYAESKRKNKNVVEKSRDKQGFSVMGATNKDMKDMGVSDETSISPFDLAKKKGSLTLEDFQDFS